MSHPAADRDEAEQHFADSVLKLRAASPPASFADRDLAGAVRPGSALTGQRCLELFDAQLASRHLDLAARWLRKIASHRRDVPEGSAEWDLLFRKYYDEEMKKVKRVRE